MTPAQGFILLVCAEEAVAAGFYAAQQDWKNAVLWSCYVVIGVAITFM